MASKEPTTHKSPGGAPDAASLAEGREGEQQHKGATDLPGTMHGLHFEHELPEADYHARPELSASRAKLLVPPSTPLAFQHALGQPEKPKRHFDVGKVVHAKVLGTPLDVEVVQKITRSKETADADDYATKSAQEHRDAIRAAGKIPLLRHELDETEAMAEAILANPDARTIMEFPSKPEVSAFWPCPDTGVECRARIDWLPDPQEGRRLILADIKTALSAWPAKFIRSAADLLYDLQAAWYLDAVTALGLDPDPVFLFVVVEKAAPHDVAVVRLHDAAQSRGQALMQRTRRIYAECTATGRWPGIPHGIHTVDLPLYEHYKHEEFIA